MLLHFNYTWTHDHDYCIHSFILLLDVEALNKPRFYLDANDSVIF